MSKSVEQEVRELVTPIAEKLGYELVDVEFIKKKGADSELILYIEQECGVGLDDCEKVSLAVDPVIEKGDPIPGPYVLCVSSPGIDRLLKTVRDFEKNIGKRVDIRFYQKQNGKKELTAVLAGVTEEAVLLEGKGEDPLALPFKNIALIRPHIDFEGESKK